MAFSSSMVDIYKEAGYRCIIMDRDNVRLALALEEQPISAVPTHGKGPAGGVLPMLWADSILFQKVQHVVHGDSREADYLDYISKRVAGGETLLPLYCNDAEIFDFRPGRFKEERPTHPEGEWNRLKRVLKNIETINGFSWCSPTGAVD